MYSTMYLLIYPRLPSIWEIKHVTAKYSTFSSKTLQTITTSEKNLSFPLALAFSLSFSRYAKPVSPLSYTLSPLLTPSSPSCHLGFFLWCRHWRRHTHTRVSSSPCSSGQKKEKKKKEFVKRRPWEAGQWAATPAGPAVGPPESHTERRLLYSSKYWIIICYPSFFFMNIFVFTVAWWWLIGLERLYSFFLLYIYIYIYHFYSPLSRLARECSSKVNKIGCIFVLDRYCILLSHVLSQNYLVFVPYEKPYRLVNSCTSKKNICHIC